MCQSDRAHMTSYYRSVVTVALSCTVFNIAYSQYGRKLRNLYTHLYSLVGADPVGPSQRRLVPGQLE